MRASHRFFVAVAATVLGMTLAVPSASGVAGFGDVEEGRFYTEPVQWMVDNDITTGTSPTCFSPDDFVTRGQAAAFMWRMEGRPEGSPAHPFSDVTAEWQQQPVSWMADNEITTGTTATTFSPDDFLTRGQLAALLHRLAGEPPAAPSGFVDVVKAWQIVPVGWLAGNGITTGTSPTTFAPEDFVTRGQAAAFFHRYKGSPEVVVDPSSPICGPGVTLTTTDGLDETFEVTSCVNTGETDLQLQAQTNDLEDPIVLNVDVTGGSGTITLSGGDEREGTVDELMVGDTGEITASGKLTVSTDMPPPPADFELTGSCV